MIRQIKFRAFLFMDKTWIYFYLNSDTTVPSGFYGGMSDWEQYTGFADKNGKEIYEGDIVKHDEYYMSGSDYSSPAGFGFVKFESGSFFVSSKTEEFVGELWNIVMGCNAEVVGNLFEIPKELETS